MPRRSGSAADRSVRIANQIQCNLAELIQRGIGSPAMGLVTLRSVTLTPDYTHAKIYFTVLGTEPEVADAILNEKAGYLHSLLFKRLHIHTVPTLHSHFGGSAGRDIEMSRLIGEVNVTHAKDD